MKYIYLLLLGFYTASVFAQMHKYVSIQQPAALVLSAGDDKIVAPNQSILLGGTPTAQFGNAGYSYLWQPATGLSDITFSNPTATIQTTTVYTVLVTDANNCTSTDTIRVTVDASGVAELLTPADIKIYQDISGKILHVEFEKQSEIIDGKIAIYNLLGQELQRKNILKTGLKTSVSFDISSYSKGVYVIKVGGQNMDVTKKFSLMN